MSTQDAVLDSLQFIELAINQLFFTLLKKLSFNKLSSIVKSPHFKINLKPIIKGLCMVFLEYKERRNQKSNHEQATGYKKLCIPLQSYD